MGHLLDMAKQEIEEFTCEIFSQSKKSCETRAVIVNAILLKTLCIKMSSKDDGIIICSTKELTFKNAYHICATSSLKQNSGKSTDLLSIIQDKSLSDIYLPFHSQDLISNSPYYLPYNSLMLVQRIWYWINY